MRRGVALYFVGSAILLALAGCGKGWLSFEEREPWRREAEAACVKSGAVRQGAAAVQISAISGPGVCGADYPFKVAALGDRTILGYVQEMRPPGAIPGAGSRAFPIPEPRELPARAAYDQRPPAYDPSPRRGTPLSIRAPGVQLDPEEDEETEPADSGPYSPPARGSGYPPPADPYAVRSGAPPALGPQRGVSASGAPASVVPAATLACPLVSRLDQWIASAVQPSAQRWFGQQVVEIKQISAYSCRGMNGQRGARISEHAFGNALDIAAFTLADGRRVTVKNGWHGSPEEQGFLRDVHAAACQQFSTVLAPGSNRFHYDHIHVDLARRRSGRQVCNPQAISGDVIARRATDRMATGSTGGGRLGFAPEQEGGGLKAPLPLAIPGED
jgi:hypothetical protein